jgi:hypothetical protein
MLQREIETFFTDAPPGSLDTDSDADNGHGRIEERTVTVSRQVDWLGGDRRFPGELRLPGATTIIRVTSRTSLPIKKIDLKETYAAQPDLRRMSPGAFRQPSCRHSPPFE